jgi:hypothetical protein
MGSNTVLPQQLDSYTVKYLRPAAFLGDSLDLHPLIPMRPDKRLIGMLRSGREQFDELWWTKLIVKRHFGDECFYEVWIFLAHYDKKDESRMKQGSVPILDRHFSAAGSVLNVPFLTFTAIHPITQRVYGYCCHLERDSGALLDIRMCEVRTLKFQMTGSAYNHSGLQTLVFGR